ncbi:formate nitrite [Cyclospora cayetanensis]|uniref:Formate nitrite n=1 Tax=Cyclospora cayetanensis TaxID=88456 RepID=A0A1D3D5J5_9EIME|nr:formate nitrite [Cyclospora cayetanensis]
MVVTASPDTYYHLLEYGMRKTRLRPDRLLLQSFMAGVYVGMAGHCCTTIAGGFSVQDGDPLAVPKSLQKLIYGMLFPVAFIAIIWTGAELFTGNTMTMLVCILEKRIKAYNLLLNWLASLFGNWLGALFVAYFLSYLTGALDDKHVSYFLFSAAKDKTSYSFGSCFLRAVGCNAFVCLAVWFVIATDDGAGKILALWFPILAFCVGGYEHIIANFYTLQAALMAGAPVSVGGCCLIGAVYWYNFYPTVSVREHLLDAGGAMPVQAIESDNTAGGDLEENDNPSLGGSLSRGGVSQGISEAPLVSSGPGLKRFSVMGSRVGAPSAGHMETSAVMVLPKESFGGHYILATPGGGPSRLGKDIKQFSFLPSAMGLTGSRVSQGKSATEAYEDATLNNTAQVCNTQLFSHKVPSAKGNIGR